MKVFISYAREDLEIAKKLRDDLEKAGISTWLDKENLLPGQNWRDVILCEIRECRYFIALLSSRALSREGFVHKELKTALDFLDHFPSDRIFLIPARIDDCQPTDEKLRYIHWADLFPSYQEGLNQILRVLIPEIKQPSNETKPIPKVEVVSPKVIEVQKEIKIEHVQEPSVQKWKYKLRKEPIKVSDNRIEMVFNVKQEKKENDTVWRPLEYIQNNFRDNGDGTVSDYATGLMWQKSGSYEWLSYEKAKTYTQELNLKNYAGYDDWRMPTVDELKSLLTSEKMSRGMYFDMYIDPIFDTTQSWCWTSDSCVPGGAFFIHFISGYISSMLSNWYVRAVRSI